ncbi:MAG: cation diffusion facilitator family transporter [Gammaproteobacteria bacterium]|nr:cation diffusion facilitator family transporter [Gammaproteobacteria bacterium]
MNTGQEHLEQAHEGHGHHHGHHHDLMSAGLRQVNLSFLIAVAANLLFTLFEAVYALVIDSMSLLGDAGHNLSDVLGLLLAWGAAYLASRKTSNLYSYGFRRTTILAAIINALFLVFASALIAFESIERFLAPVAVKETDIMIVAGIGILVNMGTALLFMKGSKTDLNLRGAFLHLAYDALISAGVVVGALVMLLTGYYIIDAVMGLLIVVVILAGTWGLLRDSMNLILDAVPRGIDRDGVEKYLSGIEGVTEVHDLHIWGLSTNENSLTAHLVMPGKTLWDKEAGYTSVGEYLRQHFNIHHVTLQIERESDCLNTHCD